MASKKHRPEEAVAKLRQVDVLVSQGQSVAEAIRAIGVTEVTYYRWRREFGGLKSDQVKRLKELEVVPPIAWCRSGGSWRAGPLRQAGTAPSLTGPVSLTAATVSSVM
jgi:transposase